MTFDIGASASIGPLNLTASIGAGGVSLAAGVASLPPPLSPNSIPLVLDDITFAAFEIPARFGPLGGEQIVAVHDFPGGVRTIQTFGAFPSDVTWTGILTGPTAADREQALDRKRVTGTKVTLTFGPWTWQGYVTEFNANIENMFFIPYRIKFVPVADTSGTATNPQGSTSPEATLAGDQSALQSANTPQTSADAADAAFDDTPTETANASGSQFNLPAAMNAPVSAMGTSVSLGLQDSNGVVAAISPPDVAAIDAANVVVAAVAASIIAGTDAIQASPTLDAQNYSQGSVNTIAAVTQPVAQVRAINPNLFSIAQQYYGDATLWQLIATASGLPPDPMPLGEFVLLIPPPQ